jgi:hypothetical protein
MGGRKKIVFNKGTSNEEHQIIEEKHHSSDFSEGSGDHSLGGGHNNPNMESLKRPVHKKIKLKKLTTQNMQESAN